jgi:hypothetical protein
MLGLLSASFTSALVTASSERKDVYVALERMLKEAAPVFSR